MLIESLPREPIMTYWIDFTLMLRKKLSRGVCYQQYKDLWHFLYFYKVEPYWNTQYFQGLGPSTSTKWMLFAKCFLMIFFLKQFCNRLNKKDLSGPSGLSVCSFLQFSLRKNFLSCLITQLFEQLLDKLFHVKFKNCQHFILYYQICNGFKLLFEKNGSDNSSLCVFSFFFNFVLAAEPYTKIP